MSKIFSKKTGILGYGGVNQSNCDMLFYDLKVFLKANGWSVVQSCDGTTVSSNSDIITAAGSGAGGMNNTNSWYVLRAPSFLGKTREFCIHKLPGSNTVNNTRAINYSVQGFSTTVGYSGAISAANPPIAYDGLRSGCYNDGATFVTPYVSMSAATYTSTGTSDHIYWNFPAGVSANPSSNYWSYTFYTDTATGSFFVYIYDNLFRPMSLFGYDVLSEYDSNDPDPVAIINMPTWTNNNSSSFFNQLFWTGNTYYSNFGMAMSWFRRPATLSALADSQQTYAYVRSVGLYPVTLNLAGLGSGYTSPAATVPVTSMTTGVLPDPYSRAIPVYGMHWGYNNPTYSGVRSIKGKSNFISLTSNPRFSNVTLSSSVAPRDYLSVGDMSGVNTSLFILPWDGSVPLAQ